ncbi:hypothetical protein ACET3Z_018450 [Daucus carota]
MSNSSSTRGAGKLSQLSQLWKALDSDFKDHILNLENKNCLFGLLSMIDVEPDMMASFIASIFDGGYYKSDRQIFLFDTHALGLTLEDVLYITGLPITGEPVLYKDSYDDGAFHRVFGKEHFQKKTTLPVKEIINIALDKDRVEGYRARKIAVLLIVLFAFIAPNNNKHEIDSVFFIIRIKKLQTALGIKLKNPPESVKHGEPWLPWIVREINKKTHNHYAKWTIDSMLPLPITGKDIIWRPYGGRECPLPRDRNSVRDLVPLFCYYVVVHHKPHITSLLTSLLLFFLVKKSIKI